MPATRTISIVQLYVRRDQMMANLRSIRSFDASVALLSPEDRARYFNTKQAEQPEQARVARKATSRTAALATLVVAAVAACDAAPVDNFTAAPAAGITSAASTDAPPAEPNTSDGGDDAGESTTDAPDAGTTTAPVDAATTSGGDDPDASTTGDASTSTATSTGDASTGGDDTTGGGESSTGEPLVELPPECLDYVPLTDSFRNVATGKTPKGCDSTMFVGWYRLQGAAGVMMPTTPPPIYSCGGHAPGWMSGGSHPTVADGVVERETCWRWDQDGDGPNYPDQPCWSTAPLKVRNCGGFFVYYMTPTPNCDSRFCGVDA